MNRSILLVVACALLAACGVKRPLIAPKDIPAYERERAEKLKRLEVKPDATEGDERSTSTSK